MITVSTFAEFVAYARGRDHARVNLAGLLAVQARALCDDNDDTSIATGSYNAHIDVYDGPTVQFSTTMAGNPSSGRGMHAVTLDLARSEDVAVFAAALETLAEGRRYVSTFDEWAEWARQYDPLRDVRRVYARGEFEALLHKAVGSTPCGAPVRCSYWHSRRNDRMQADFTELREYTPGWPHPVFLMGGAVTVDARDPSHVAAFRSALESGRRSVEVASLDEFMQWTKDRFAEREPGDIGCEPWTWAVGSFADQARALVGVTDPDTHVRVGHSYDIGRMMSLADFTVYKHRGPKPGGYVKDLACYLNGPDDVEYLRAALEAQ